MSALHQLLKLGKFGRRAGAGGGIGLDFHQGKLSPLRLRHA